MIGGDQQENTPLYPPVNGGKISSSLPVYRQGQGGGYGTQRATTGGCPREPRQP